VKQQVLSTDELEWLVAAVLEATKLRLGAREKAVGAGEHFEPTDRRLLDPRVDGRLGAPRRSELSSSANRRFSAIARSQGPRRKGDDKRSFSEIALSAKSGSAP